MKPLLLALNLRSLVVTALLWVASSIQPCVVQVLTKAAKTAEAKALEEKPVRPGKAIGDPDPDYEYEVSQMQLQPL